METPKKLNQEDMLKIAEILNLQPNSIKKMSFEIYQVDTKGKSQHSLREMAPGTKTFSFCPCPPDYQDFHFSCC